MNQFLNLFTRNKQIKTLQLDLFLCFTSRLFYKYLGRHLVSQLCTKTVGGGIGGGGGAGAFMENWFSSGEPDAHTGSMSTFASGVF